MTKKNESRAQAIENGDKHYEGAPCKKCGCTKRYVSSYECYECGRKRGLLKLQDNELMAQYRTKEKVNKRLKKWRKDNPIQYKTQALKRFGITGEEYEQMLKEQNGVCKICGNGKTDKMLAVDHCHDTGTIRGLLCFRCNTGLGFFHDNIELLQKAKEYLS